MRARTTRNSDGCWLWDTPVDDKRPYGIVYWDGRQQRVHRVSHLIFIGPIPPKYEVDHLCGRTLCLSPTHIEAVTKAENLRRQKEAGAYANSMKTHCPKGHEYTAENTKTNAQGHRWCRQCHREKSLEYYYRNRESCMRRSNEARRKRAKRGTVNA